MATFRIGQRVRVVRVVESTEALGKQATVLGYCQNAVGIGGQKRWAGYDLDIDGLGAMSPRGYRYCFEADRLEPIIDSHQPCEAEFKLHMDSLLEREGVGA